MFASSSKSKSSHRLAVAVAEEEFPRDVYGAVVQNTNLESTTHDPGIDILHSLLLDSTSVEVEEAAKRYVRTHARERTTFTFNHKTRNDLITG